MYCSSIHCKNWLYLDRDSSQKYFFSVLIQRIREYVVLMPEKWSLRVGLHYSTTVYLHIQRISLFVESPDNYFARDYPYVYRESACFVFTVQSKFSQMADQLSKGNQIILCQELPDPKAPTLKIGQGIRPTPTPNILHPNHGFYFIQLLNREYIQFRFPILFHPFPESFPISILNSDSCKGIPQPVKQAIAIHRT